MKLIGLTGGIGMGKSTSADLLARQGVPIIDTDAIARDIVEPGQPALLELAAAFGQDILATNGTLRRAELAKKVFGDPALRQQLEGILHPRIRERWLNQVERWRLEGRPCGVVVIPLLFETGAETQFDKIVCTACTAESQRERLLKRGWSQEESSARMRAQWPVEKKMSLSNFVVWTEGAVESHAAQWERILAGLGILQSLRT